MPPTAFERNTRLRDLVVDHAVQSDPLRTTQLYDVLLKLVSQLSSTRLELLILRITLPTTQLDDTNAGCTPLLEQPNADEVIVSPFHAALSRPHFDCLSGPAEGGGKHQPVHLKFCFFDGVSPPPEEASSLSSATEAFVEVLFEPWLRRGLVHLELPNGYEVNYWKE